MSGYPYKTRAWLERRGPGGPDLHPVTVLGPGYSYIVQVGRMSPAPVTIVRVLVDGEEREIEACRLEMRPSG